MLEVFASIQGEGKYVGEPQVFLRLAGCPLRCRWCDTPGSWTLDDSRTARIAHPDGPVRAEAWSTPFRCAVWIGEVEPGEPRTVSVTGGEPLLWPDFLRALRPMIAPRRLHLETGGGHPETLARVLDVADHVSLDLKLPADLDAPVELHSVELPDDGDERAGPTSEPAPRDADEWRTARRRTLALVTGRDACAKVVVAGGRRSSDFVELFEDLARIAPDVPLYLTPATPVRGIDAPTASLVDETAERARDLELDVRVLPQVHRLMRRP